MIGTPPPELANLANLELLDLNGNDLSGEIPPEFGGLANLLYLDLGGNGMIGEMPPELANLSNLFYLDLSQNDLSGEIPPELGGLVNLAALDLGGNALVGTLPPELGSLANLSLLILSDNRLVGEIPSELGGLAKLKQLSVSGNDYLHGCFPDVLAPLANRLSCEEARRNLSEGALSDRAALVALYTATDGANWERNRNWLTYRSLDSWDGVSANETGRVTALHLNENMLNGELPAELGNLDKLDSLDLRGNQLSGCIPNSLGNASGSRMEHPPFCETGRALQESIASDKAALTALYNSTNGASWTNSANWLTNAPISEWHGVFTNGAGARYVGSPERKRIERNLAAGTRRTRLPERIVHLRKSVERRNTSRIRRIRPTESARPLP